MLKITGKKLILILLYSSTDSDKINIPINGRTRMMKMGFLFKKEIIDNLKKSSDIESANLPKFFAWKYGPFSSEFLNDLEFLINQNYVLLNQGKDIPISAELIEYNYWIEKADDYTISEYNSEVFSLTEEKGIPKAEELWKQLNTNQIHIIKDFKKMMCNATLDRIIDYTYKKYKKDGYIDKSLIRDKYLD